MANDDIEKTIALYSDQGWKKWFSKIRFWDAPYINVEMMLPKKGTIVDLGCGEGIFTNFVGISSTKRKLIGVEFDKTRAYQASRGVKNVTFKRGDATKFKIPNCDAIIMFHLLHHLKSYKDQEKVIENCFKSLKKGGTLVIVEIDIVFTFKYLTTYIVDHFIVPWIFEKRLYSDIFFRKKQDWNNLLKNNGFRVKSYDMNKNMPFSHVVFLCTKG